MKSIMTEYPIKLEAFGAGVKHERKKRKFVCPFCGNETSLKKIGIHLFCRSCHKRMEWTAAIEDNTPVKETIK